MKKERLAHLEQQYREVQSLWVQAQQAMLQHREALLRLEGAILEVRQLPDDPQG